MIKKKTSITIISTLDIITHIIIQGLMINLLVSLFLEINIVTTGDHGFNISKLIIIMGALCMFWIFSFLRSRTTIGFCLSLLKEARVKKIIK